MTTTNMERQGEGVTVEQRHRDTAAVHHGWTSYQSAALFASSGDLALTDNTAYLLAQFERTLAPPNEPVVDLREAVAREVKRMRESAADWRRPALRQVEGPNDLKIYGGTIADDFERWADLLERGISFQPDRLEVARIIDPETFSNIGCTILKDRLGDLADGLGIGSPRAHALAKADAILALAKPVGDLREAVRGISTVPNDVAARQLMGLYYELSGNPDMAEDVRSEHWEDGTGLGPGSERALLGVMAAMVEAVRQEFAKPSNPSGLQEAEAAEILRRVLPLLGRAESNASGTPDFDHVGPLVAEARAFVSKMEKRS